jgi:hypothetical protein
VASRFADSTSQTEPAHTAMPARPDQPTRSPNISSAHSIVVGGVRYSKVLAPVAPNLRSASR